MRTDQPTDLKDSKVSLRIDEDSRALIDLAAKHAGKSRSAFMIEASRKNAEKILSSQTNFSLSQDEWVTFNKLLDQDPSKNEKLRKLLTTKAPWE